MTYVRRDGDVGEYGNVGLEDRGLDGGRTFGIERMRLTVHSLSRGSERVNVENRR